MQFSASGIKDLFIIAPHFFSDSRGTLVKTFRRNDFIAHGLRADFEETFYSVSRKDVIRGFHLQLPPRASEKIIWVTQGMILDVALDLRKKSGSYGQCFSLELSAENRLALYLPQGVAHAFCVLSDSATVGYQVSSIFSPKEDGGVRWNSAGFKWPVDTPIVSPKDEALPELKDFRSPF